jgi:hypothetical protein
MGCVRIVFLTVFLVIGLASVSILIKIGGKSDGPGALVFYIGAAVGLFGAWTCVAAGWSGPKGRL